MNNTIKKFKGLLDDLGLTKWSLIWATLSSIFIIILLFESLNPNSNIVITGIFSAIGFILNMIMFIVQFAYLDNDYII